MRFALAGAPLSRRVRLWGGLTLFSYVLLHLSNHALGLISLGAMEQGLTWALLLWRSPPGMVLLYSALITHLGLGLWALYRRRTLRMPAWEAAQLVLGLAIPALLLSHIAGTRVTDALLDTTPSYARVLLFL
ncbi:MAG TPA: adenylate/guanylate cyclase domain-containing protein, partial [Methylomirabilota bacterium]